MDVVEIGFLVISLCLIPLTDNIKAMVSMTKSISLKKKKEHSSALGYWLFILLKLLLCWFYFGCLQRFYHPKQVPSSSSGSSFAVSLIKLPANLYRINRDPRSHISVSLLTFSQVPSWSMICLVLFLLMQMVKNFTVHIVY